MHLQSNLLIGYSDELCAASELVESTERINIPIYIHVHYSTLDKRPCLKVIYTQIHKYFFLVVNCLSLSMYCGYIDTIGSFLYGHFHG